MIDGAIGGLRREPPVPPEALAAMRAPFEAFGAGATAEWTSPPVLQPLSAILDMAGEAMRSRLFVVQGEGAEELALRPDFTIALARAHIASGATEARRLYAGDAFRTAPRGSSRPTEFLQLGVEVFGESGDPALRDAEVAALAWNASAAGGRTDLSLVMGDIGLFAAFVSAIGLPEGVRTRLVQVFASGRPVGPELARLSEAGAAAVPGGRLSQLLADLPEAEGSAVLEELWRLAGIQPVGGRGAGEIVHRLVERAQAERAPKLTVEEAERVRRFLEISATPPEALDRVQQLAHEAHGGIDPLLEAWRRRLKEMVRAGVPEAVMTLSTGFVRPFGYYDGLLFEVRSAALSADEPVAAGGRSDGLPARLGGAAQTSVGCMVRPGRAWAGASR